MPAVDTQRSFVDFFFGYLWVDFTDIYSGKVVNWCQLEVNWTFREIVASLKTGQERFLDLPLHNCWPVTYHEVIPYFNLIVAIFWGKKTVICRCPYFKYMNIFISNELSLSTPNLSGRREMLTKEGNSKKGEKWPKEKEKKHLKGVWRVEWEEEEREEEKGRKV